MLQLLGSRRSRFGKIVTGAGVKNAARGVDQQTAILRHAIFAHLLQTSTLRTYTGNQQKMMGNNTANVFEQFALRGPHDIHQMLIRRIHARPLGKFRRLKQY